MKFIYIEWVDSGTFNGWTDIDEANKPPLKIVSCGIFIMETKETVVIANSFNREVDAANGIISIPKACITKRKWVKV